MKLSKLTISLGIYIIVSAIFMNQVWGLFERSIGAQNVRALAISALFIAAMLLFWRVIRSSTDILKMLLNLAIIGSLLIFSLRQPYLVEKLHVVEYGLLGWLAGRDLNKNKVLLKNVFFAFFFAALISLLDEGLQRLLPWRVGDLRDVFTNFISSALGLVFFALSYRRYNIAKAR